MDEFQELSRYIEGKVQGVFEPYEMAVLKEELTKLEPGQVYVEIGVDEGRSFYAASRFARPEVIRIGIDINDPPAAFINPPETYIGYPAYVAHGCRGEQVSIGRSQFFQEEKLVGLRKNGFYVHGDANNFAKLFHQPFVDLIFIDGFHDYDSVRKNVDLWLPLMKPGSTMLFHDYLDPNSTGVKPVVNETFGDKAEIIGELARIKL